MRSWADVNTHIYVYSALFFQHVSSHTYVHMLETIIFIGFANYLKIVKIVKKVGKDNTTKT